MKTNTSPKKRNLLPSFLGLLILGIVGFILLFPKTSSQVLGLQSGVRYKEKVFTEVEITKDIKYGSAKPYGSNTATNLVLDLYKPKDDPITARPVIILVHGGGFVGGNKEFWSPQAIDWGRELALRGYVVIAIKYRLMQNFDFSMTAAALPTAIKQAREDAMAAVRWTRANASTHKINPQKISMGGYSAGAITSYYTSYDTANVGTSGNPGQSSLVNAAFGIAGGMLTQDLAKIQTGENPFLIIHGMTDVVVPVTFAQQVEAKLVEKNIPHTSHYYTGVGHDVIFRSDVLTKVTDFLYVHLDLDQPQGTKPSVQTTGEAQNITASSAKVTGKVVNDGGSAVTERGVVYSSTVSAPTVANGTKKANGNGVGVYATNITGLEIGTKYYARAYATNSKGTAYGEVIDFTTRTSATKPTVITEDPATSITKQTAIVSGEITSTGGSAITERGVVYSKTDTTPTLSNGTKILSTDNSLQFDVTLTQLLSGTKYYARAFATNAKGTSYGVVISFTTATQATAPSVKTKTPATSVTQTSAKITGEVLSDGGSPIIERGIIYSSTKSRPTLASQKVTASGTTGNFTSTLTGLTKNTKYYARAYAKNNIGVSYGAVIEFTTTTVTHTPEDTGFSDSPLLYIGAALYSIGVLTFVGARVLNSKRKL